MITAISFTADGKRILTGSQDRTARLWDAEKGTELITLKGHTHVVNDAQFSPDGKRISTSWDKTARIWDLERFLEAKAADDKAPEPK